ncbi:hypothetical protein [Luteolibacter luteus]|uniref:HEAT repeat domain-containing protein n=1 Tax=Luteolibacter luteus TaxID=2728835 RepID=A0A858RE65_9BACT|nr:hypothetical protein [Luteolibacter luteus]QJE95015.1 hypothetical protein HHL09_04250 [Luteolibacter luteus]
MKLTRRLAGALLLAAVILAALALQHARHSTARDGKSRGDRSHAAFGFGRSAKQREQDPLRHHRLAQRLLEATRGTAMTNEAGDGESNFHKMVDSFAADDFAAVMDELASLDQTGDLRLKLLLAWTERDPHAAASFVGDGPLPVEASRIVAGSWAKHDPAAALSWARGLSQEAPRQQALIGCGSELAFHDPQQAIDLAIEAGTIPATEELLNQAAGAWATKDPGSAAAWANAITDTALREKLVGGVASAWADQDPRAASKLVIDSMHDGSLEENALVGIVQRIAFKDMAKAREWVAQFPEGRMRERAEAELARITGRMGGSPLTSQH